MQLDKENIRKLRGLIVFTLIILVGLLRFDVVLDGIGFILHILFPFLLGGAIAFVLSVPMNRIDKRLFGKAKEGSRLDKASAPLSLIITLILVLAVLSLVVIVVLPELGKGFHNYLFINLPVLHRPHGSRPWKKLKYTNPLKYYWLKYTKGLDKI